MWDLNTWKTKLPICWYPHKISSVHYHLALGKHSKSPCQTLDYYPHFPAALPNGFAFVVHSRLSIICAPQPPQMRSSPLSIAFLWCEDWKRRSNVFFSAPWKALSKYFLLIKEINFWLLLMVISLWKTQILKMYRVYLVPLLKTWWHFSTTFSALRL